jgi:AbrB family looped-hinge helix DNA binding protein
MVTIEEDVKVIQVGNSLRIAIPSTICKALRIERGQTIHVETTDGEILLRPITSKKRG